MKEFSDLYLRLDQSNRTRDKLAALEDYLRQAPDKDAAWALYFLMGNRLKRTVAPSVIRECIGEASGHPSWMVERCYEAVGDLAETAALLVPDHDRQAVDSGASLSTLIDQHLLPLRDAEPAQRKQTILEWWRRLDRLERLVFNKILTGGLRVGVSRSLVTRALASVTGVELSVLAHRLMGSWTPEAGAYRALFNGAADDDHLSRPYPFCLANPLPAASSDQSPSSLGEAVEWCAEWKWDGIRAQLIHRPPTIALWSRGEMMIEDSFPELVEAAARLPAGTVLDGEILVWRDETPAAFADLQRRLNRKQPGPKARERDPVVFMAYDLLEENGEDMRSSPFASRRTALESLSRTLDGSHLPLRLSPLLSPASWDKWGNARKRSRERGVEGLILKHRDSPYHAGRVRGGWWKWKVDSLALDAILLYAQAGHGRRAGLYTAYTFGLRGENGWIPFAKAYSGLTDTEIRELDRWIRRHTRERHGPVRVVDPELVFEIAFDGVSSSRRHKSGLAVRFPRIRRWRRDKTAGEADSVDSLRNLLSNPH